MKKNRIVILLIVLALTMFLVSCKDSSTDPEIDKFEILQDYMAANNFDIADISAGWVKPGSLANAGAVPTAVDSFAVSYSIIDIRTAEDFEAGHIRDAVNTTLGNILAVAAEAENTIMVVCYTGQTSARAVTALRLSGHTDAVSLKWGMGGWNATFNTKWADNAVTEVHADWQTTGDPTEVATFDYPTFSTDSEDGAEILAERVNTILALDWKQGNEEVLAAPTTYFINNYWSEDSWNTYGHIEGAYRISENLNLNGLGNLDPNVTKLVTYCYTGQTSALITGWLQVLGYENARSLLYGANGIMGETIPAKSWHGDGSASELNYGYFQTVEGEEVYVEPTL